MGCLVFVSSFVFLAGLLLVFGVVFVLDLVELYYLFIGATGQNVRSPHILFVVTFVIVCSY